MTLKLKRMREIVKQELIHIPDLSAPQRELRMVYWRNRMKSLGRKVDKQKTAKEVLEESILVLKEEYPDNEFTFDEEFFK